MGGEGENKCPKHQYSLWVRSDRILFLWQKAVFWIPVIMRSRFNINKNCREIQSIK